MISRNRLWISMVTIALLLNAGAGRSHAQVNPTVPLTVNVNLQLTKLHPSVTMARVVCDVTFAVVNGVGGTKTNHATATVVNRAYTGTLSIKFDVEQGVFANAANRTVPVNCKLRFGGASGEIIPNATATQPQAITSTNAGVVATGAVTGQTQNVTFPNTAP